MGFQEWWKKHKPQKSLSSSSSVSSGDPKSSSSLGSNSTFSYGTSSSNSSQNSKSPSKNSGTSTTSRVSSISGRIRELYKKAKNKIMPKKKDPTNPYEDIFDYGPGSKPPGIGPPI